MIQKFDGILDWCTIVKYGYAILNLGCPVMQRTGHVKKSTQNLQMFRFLPRNAFQNGINSHHAVDCLSDIVTKTAVMQNLLDLAFLHPQVS